MSQELDLKAIERKAWRTTHEDGLMELMLGLIVFAMGLYAWMDDIWTDSPWTLLVYASLVGVAVLVMTLGKRYITVPRMGLVKFGAKGRARHARSALVLGASVVLGLLVYLFTVGMQDGRFIFPWNARVFFPLLFAVNILVVFGLMAYFLDYPRLYIVAVIFAMALPLRELMLNLGVGSTPWAFGIAAIFIAGMGIQALTRFIRTYPLPVDGDDVPR